ncbi:MAG: OmpA family protein [Bdellovibrio sp.]
MKTILGILFSLISTATFANQEQSTTSSMEFSREEAATTPQGILPFIAIGGGYTGYDTFNDVEGTPATLKLLGSYYFSQPWVMDLGYGVNNQQFIHSGNNENTAITGGALEVAARYNWDSRWQAGVVANHLFEQGPEFLAEQGDAQFVGLQVLKEFNMSASWLARIGARAMSLTNNTGSMVNMYMIDLQIGWNPSAYRPSVRQTSAAETVAPTPASVQDENPVAREPATDYARPVALTQPEPILRDISYGSLVASGGFIQFDSSRYALSAQDQQRIAQIAQVLNENKDLFERVEIHGYTDSSGGQALNQRISTQRANQVRTALQQNGLSGVNVMAVGKGSAESTGNMDEDRRAELIFVGVKDEEKLREALSTIE